MIMTLVMIGGCQTARVEQPLTVKYGSSEPQVAMDFWHTLEGMPVASNDDALHALLLFTDGTDPANDYAGRIAELKQRGWLPDDFDGPANEGVRRGVMAVVLVNALEISGGLTMHVFGPTERYAVRELQHARIYPLSSPHQTFTGAQYLALIGRIEDYVREKKPNLFNMQVAAGDQKELH